MKNVNVDNSVGISKKGKRFIGVFKQQNKWRARVWHPKLKIHIRLGSYGTPEEAAAAVQKKKGEFKEMFKQDNNASAGMNMDDSIVETTKSALQTCRRFRGVSKRNDKWEATVCHPKLNTEIYLGYYDSPEEAITAVNKKKAEYEEMSGWRKEAEPSFKCLDDVVEQPECGVSNTSACVDECGVVKVPAGVRKIPSGKWIARIKDPDAKARIWLGTYDTFAEAVRAFYKKEAVFAAKRKKVELEQRTVSGNARCIKSESEVGHQCRKSALGLENLNGWAVNNKPTYVASNDAIARDNLQINSGYGLSSSDLEPEVSIYQDVINKSVTRENIQKRIVSASSFDEAVSLGFIDEYGQLLGQHSTLDEYECLNLPDDTVAFT